MKTLKKTLVLAALVSFSSISHSYDSFTSPDENINSCTNNTVTNIVSDLLKEPDQNLLSEPDKFGNQQSNIRNGNYLKALADVQIQIKQVETFDYDPITLRTQCNATVFVDGISKNTIFFETYVVDGGENVGVRLLQNYDEARYYVHQHTMNKTGIPFKDVILTNAQIEERNKRLNSPSQRSNDVDE